MKINFERTGIFIPTWNGNEALDDTEQIKVHWQYPTNIERIEIFKRGGINYNILFGRMIIKIDNFPGEDLKLITTGLGLLADKGTGGICDEVGIFLMERMTAINEDTKKK